MSVNRNALPPESFKFFCEIADTKRAIGGVIMVYDKREII